MGNRRLQITLQPEVLRWARERIDFSPEELARKMQVKPDRVLEWEDSGQISVAQVDGLAAATHTPAGFLYMSEPPEEVLPIADFRTLGDRPPRRPSPDLLETVYAMQRRQAWMRDELIADEALPLDFVGAFMTASDPRAVAAAMRAALALQPDWAAGVGGWEDALRFLRVRIEEVGILVVVNGVVGNNNFRSLDPEEFRAFALMDDYAPLIFVNNKDYKSAQMFTMAHELAHIFVGEDGVSNFEELQPAPHGTEIFCNSVAAEFLVPGEELRAYWPTVVESPDPYQSVARRFKVSGIVAARRALDLRLIDPASFSEFYREYVERERRKGPGGGNFWNNQNVRVGKRFGAAVARAVAEGRLLYRDAYALTGLKGDTFVNMARNMGVQL